MATDLARDYRYTVLEDLRRHVIAIVVLIYETHDATQPQDKLKYLDQALQRVVVIFLHLRILKDCARLSLKRYASASEQTVAVENHLTGWRDYYRKIQLETNPQPIMAPQQSVQSDSDVGPE